MNDYTGDACLYENAYVYLIDWLRVPVFSSLSHPHTHHHTRVVASLTASARGSALIWSTASKRRASAPLHLKVLCVCVFVCVFVCVRVCVVCVFVCVLTAEPA